MLGINIEKVEKRIKISQKIYTEWILEKFGMLKYKPWSISFQLEYHSVINIREDQEDEENPISWSIGTIDVVTSYNLS